MSDQHKCKGCLREFETSQGLQSHIRATSHPQNFVDEKEVAVLKNNHKEQIEHLRQFYQDRLTHTRSSHSRELAELKRQLEASKSSALAERISALEEENAMLRTLLPQYVDSLPPFTPQDIKKYCQSAESSRQEQYNVNDAFRLIKRYLESGSQYYHTSTWVATERSPKLCQVGNSTSC